MGQPCNEQTLQDAQARMTILKRPCHHVSNPQHINVQLVNVSPIRALSDYCWATIRSPYDREQICAQSYRVKGAR
jgi:hypothetical protein